MASHKALVEIILQMSYNSINSKLKKHFIAECSKFRDTVYIPRISITSTAWNQVSVI